MKKSGILEKLKFSIIFATLSLPLSLDAGLASQTTTVPGFKLKLNEELYFSDKNGVFLLDQVCGAEIGRQVKIYRTDGFCYSGRITEIEESETIYKVYGTVSNVDNTQFGFVMAKGGIFAGAVVEKTAGTTYVLELDEHAKGFVLVRSFAKKI